MGRNDRSRPRMPGCHGVIRQASVPDLDWSSQPVVTTELVPWKQVCGLIVDYNGMLRSLRQALAQYALGDEEDGEDGIAAPLRCPLRSTRHSSPPSSGALTIDLKLFGLSGTDEIDNAESTTKSTDWTVTLQSSFTATAQSSTSISGNLDDHHGLGGTAALPARPHVQVFQDTLFGSFLFQDPTAPSPPAR